MLREKLKNYNVILASGSPRRQQFFKELDLDFIIQIKEIEEKFPKHLKGAEITDFLANLKSQAFTNLTEKDLLITSDTIVWLENKALGKPKNKQEAYTMLKQLSGKKHEVITSISIRNNNFQKIINDTTVVYFKEISDKEITYYINNYNPYDKAGAYGIQEWIGTIGIENISGSYTNIVGLPMAQVVQSLIRLTSNI